MRAAQISEYGGKDVLKTVDDASKPTPRPGEVLVEVRAAAVNPFDYKVREGLMKNSAPLKFPAILGGDLAGIVASLGDDTSGFKVGDEVFGQANALSGHGSYAEFTPVKSSSLAVKPKSLDFISSAAVPLAGVSAYQALVEHAELKDGQKILIHGGAGGIGSYAIQLAKHLSAYVATTAAPEDLEYVKGLGANKAIDYNSQKFEDLLKDYDVVYDTVGGQTFEKSHQILKPGGIIVSMVAQPNDELTNKYKIRVISQFTRVTTERLEKLAALVDNGAIKVQIDKTFPLEQAAEALEYIKIGKHRGKVVLKIK